MLEGLHARHLMRSPLCTKSLESRLRQGDQGVEGVGAGGLGGCGGLVGQQQLGLQR